MLGIDEAVRAVAVRNRDAQARRAPTIELTGAHEVTEGRTRHVDDADGRGPRRFGVEQRVQQDVQRMGRCTHAITR